MENYGNPQKKQFFSGITNDNNKNNNDNKSKDSDDKNINYTNNTSISKMSIKQSIKEKNINDKCNELNILFNKMQSITKEILSKKV